MNPFEMVAVIVVAVMIASVLRGEIRPSPRHRGRDADPAGARRNPAAARRGQGAEGTASRCLSGSPSTRKTALARRSRSCATASAMTRPPGHCLGAAVTAPSFPRTTFSTNMSCSKAKIATGC